MKTFLVFIFILFISICKTTFGKVYIESPTGNVSVPNNLEITKVASYSYGPQTGVTIDLSHVSAIEPQVYCRLPTGKKDGSQYDPTRVFNDGIDRSNIEGRVVAFGKSWCSHEQAIRALQYAGAKAILGTQFSSDSEYPGFLYHTRHNWQDKSMDRDINVPCLEIQGILMDFLYKTENENKDHDLMIYVDQVEKNTWTPVFNTYGVVFQVVMALWSLVILALVVQRYLGFRKSGHDPAKNPVIGPILLLEFTGNFIRLFWFCVDPIQMRHIFGMRLAVVFYQLTVPLYLTSILLVAVFFYNVSSSSGVSLRFKIGNAVKVALLIGAFMTLLQVTASILSASYLPSLMVVITVNVVIGAVIIIIVSIYFIWSGILLLRQLQNSPTSNSDNDSKLKRVARYLISSTIGAISYIIMMVFFTTNIPYAPANWISVFLVAYCGIMFASMMQILALQPVKRRGERGSSLNMANNKSQGSVNVKDSDEVNENSTTKQTSSAKGGSGGSATSV